MEEYKYIEPLGKGSFGRVYKAQRVSDNSIVAIKEVDYSLMSDRQKKMLVNEVNILRKLDNKYIVRYVDRYVDKTRKKMFIVMDYCSNGDLQKHIKKIQEMKCYIPECQVWQALAELSLALCECHTSKDIIIHRDIKPGNIFIDKEKNIKLGDFGLARPIFNGMARTCAGTPLYMSPEVNSGKPYDEKSDIWALGCVIYEMANLSPPFKGYCPADLKRKIMTTSPRRLHSKYSKELNHVISMMLRKDPDQRPSIDEILEYPRVKITVKLINLQSERERYRNDIKDMLNKKSILIEKLRMLKSIEDTHLNNTENIDANILCY